MGGSQADGAQGRLSHSFTLVAHVLPLCTLFLGEIECQPWPGKGLPSFLAQRFSNRFIATQTCFKRNLTQNPSMQKGSIEGLSPYLPQDSKVATPRIWKSLVWAQTLIVHMGELRSSHSSDLLKDTQRVGSWQNQDGNRSSQDHQRTSRKKQNSWGCREKGQGHTGCLKNLESAGTTQCPRFTEGNWDPEKGQ